MTTAPATAPPDTATYPHPDPLDTARPWLVWLIPALVTTLISVFSAQKPTFWTDEAATISATTRSTGDLFHLLGFIDAVHGTYYLLMHLWVSLFGTSEMSMRFPSALAVGAAAAAIALIGRDLAGPVVGLCSGVVFAVLPISNQMGLEARPQAFVTAAVCWSFYALIVAQKRQGNWWFGYVGALALALMFSILALLIIPAHYLTFRKRRVPQKFAAAIALAMLPCLGILALAVGQRAQVSWLQTTSFSDVPHLLEDVWFQKSTLLAATAWILMIIGALIAVVKKDHRVLAFTVPWLLLPVTVLFLVSLHWPLLTPRYVAYSSGAIALLIGYGLIALAELFPRRPMKAAFVVAAFLLLMLVSGPTIEKLQSPGGGKSVNLRHIAVTIDALREPGDGVLYDPASRRLAAIAYPDVFKHLKDVAVREQPPEAGNLAGREVSPGAVIGRLAGVPRVWCVSGPAGLSPARRQLLLDEGYNVVKVWTVTGAHIDLLQRTPEPQ